MEVGICKSMMYNLASALRKWTTLIVLGVIAEIMIFTLVMKGGDVGNLTYYGILTALIACKLHKAVRVVKCLLLWGWRERERSKPKCMRKKRGGGGKSMYVQDIDTQDML